MLGLSLEQQFELRRFAGVVSTLSREQAQQQLIKLYEQYLLTGNLYEQMLRHQWGIESMPTIGGDRDN